MGKAQEFTDANFQSEVLDSDQPVLVDFWATWCGPCRAVGPTIEELAEQYDGTVKFGKLNIDENPQSPNGFGIQFDSSGAAVQRRQGRRDLGRSTAKGTI